MDLGTIGRSGLLALLLLGWASQAPADEKATGSDSPTRCAGGLERFLPGDYYFCAGTRELSEGHAGRAVSLYESSAAWGDKRAQYNLGLLYYQGRHVPKDKALGIAWLVLSAERPDATFYRQVATSAYRSAAPETQARASVLLHDLNSRYADAVARSRALRRFERNTRDLLWNARWSPQDRIWIEGLEPTRTSALIAVLNDIADQSLDRANPAMGKVTVGSPETLPPGTP